MNPIAHNLSVKKLIDALSSIPVNCEYVDAMVEDELTLVFRPSVNPEEDDDDIEQTII